MMSVQIGFVVGALLSASLNVADRIPAHTFFAASALFGALVNAAVTVAPGPVSAIGFRFLTGVALAGVYPPGIKLVATWCKEDRGEGIGLLVGAFTVGSAQRPARLWHCGRTAPLAHRCAHCLGARGRRGRDCRSFH